MTPAYLPNQPMFYPNQNIQPPQLQNYISTTPAQIPAVQPQAPTNIIWVQGEAGANAFPVGRNSTVWLMDSTQPVLYIKSADNLGRPQPLEKYHLVSDQEYLAVNNSEPIDYISREEFEKYVSEAENKFVIRREKNNGKPAVQ